jgi:tetratricopeptide (TPR) repeat protein
MMGHSARARAIALSFGLSAGCAPYPGALVSDSGGGDLRVEVRDAQSFEALARFLYGDARLGPAVAQLSGLPYDEGVPAGVVLSLPPKPAVERHSQEEAKAESLLKKGRSALAAGKFDDAAEKLEAARELRPERSDVLLLLGTAHMRAQRLDEASPLLERAARQRPGDPEARYALGTLYRRQDRLPDALFELEAAIDALGEGGGNPRISYDHALTLQELGRRTEARDAFQRFLYEFPSDPWAENARRNLEELGKPVAP